MRYDAGIIIYRMCGEIPEVLLLFNGRWSPPKGGREQGESEVENALRETYEETGLTQIMSLKSQMSTQNTNGWYLIEPLFHGIILLPITSFPKCMKT